MTDRGLWRAWWQIVGLLIILALAVRGGIVESVDMTIATWAEGLDARWRPVAGVLTFFGSVPWCLCLMGLTTFVWWGREHLPVVAAFWGAFGLGLLVQIALRFLVAHWRPDAPAEAASFGLVARYDAAGFTSGHAYRAAYLYGWWALRMVRQDAALSRLTAVICTLLVLVVGLTRILLGRHWVTDIVGAWLLAAAALQGAELWLRHTRAADH